MLPQHQLKLALIHPEIPQNTGNIARLCAVTGAQLHLVRPLGFFLTDRHFKRSGMDYVKETQITVHDNLEALFAAIAADNFWLTSASATTPHWSAKFSPADWLILGSESAGLPTTLLEKYPTRKLQIPMNQNQRGLNLSTSAGILLYEALRQVASASC